MSDAESLPKRSWRPMVTIIALSIILAVLGYFLSTAVGLPGLVQLPLDVVGMVLHPFLIGGGLGILLIGLSYLTPTQYRIPQLPFPDSLVPYVIGGTYEEILFRLFLLPLFIWLLYWIPTLRDGYGDVVFWGTAVTLTLLYSLMQLAGIKGVFKIPTIAQIPPALLLSILLASGFGSLIGAYYFREGGFVASYALRVGIYLIWHIVWGAYAVPSGLVPHRREVEAREARAGG